MSAGDRPQLVKRPAGGVALHLPSVLIGGATEGQIFVVASDGSGGLELVGVDAPSILAMPEPAQDGSEDGFVVTVQDVGSGVRAGRWVDPGTPLVQANAQLRFSGLHTITGSGSYVVHFTRDAHDQDGTSTNEGPGLSLPDGGAYVKRLRVRILASNITGNATLRVHINGSGSTIAIDVTGLGPGAVVDTLHAEAVADNDALSLALEVNGGNVAAEEFQFTASLALSGNATP